MTDQTEHDADRETWDCLVCGEPWPCAPAKVYMLETMRPTELAIAQWQHLEEAVFTLGGKNSKALWDRFLGWSRRSPTVR